MRRRAASPTSTRRSRKSFCCSAPTRSIRSASRTASRSTSAITATMERARPTSSFRARPMPKSTAPTSTPKAACSVRRAGRVRSRRGARGLDDLPRGFRPARRRRCRSTASTSSARRWSRTHPQLGVEGLIAFDWSPPKLDTKAEGAVVYPIRDFYLTNAIAAPARLCSFARTSWFIGVQCRRPRNDRDFPVLWHDLRMVVVHRHDHRHPA